MHSSSWRVVEAEEEAFFRVTDRLGFALRDGPSPASSSPTTSETCAAICVKGPH
jgi:hypothetical protein